VRRPVYAAIAQYDEPDRKRAPCLGCMPRDLFARMRPNQSIPRRKEVNRGQRQTLPCDVVQLGIELDPEVHKALEIDQRNLAALLHPRPRPHAWGEAMDPNPRVCPAPPTPFNSIVAQAASALRPGCLNQRPLYGFESHLSLDSLGDGAA
jgi:hypothetical protein